MFPSCMRGKTCAAGEHVHPTELGYSSAEQTLQALAADNFDPKQQSQ